MYEELKRKNLTGLRFGSMQVVREFHRGPNNQLTEECLCDCGNMFYTTRSSILNRNTIRCPKCSAKRRGEMRREDLTGQKFSRLFVKEFCGIRENDRRSLWKCICDCGKETVVTNHDLKSGNTKSCGCLNRELVRCSGKYQDITGKRYGRATVLYRIESGPQGSRWHCICDCGREFDTYAKYLNSGMTDSCGQHRAETLSEIFREDLTGQRFYHLTILSPAPRKKEKTQWNYQCDCGRFGVAASTNLKSGKIRSCGKCINYSIGEEKIEEFLNQHHIQYVREKKFIGCEDVGKLRFDFYVGSSNLAIEYDGVFHYQETTLGNDLDGQQRRDKIKDQYCEENEIRLLRIPYWEFENIESILTDWLFLYDTEETNSSDVSLSA